MFNAVLSIVNLFSAKEEAVIPAPSVEPREVNYGVRLAVLCTDLHEAMQANNHKLVDDLHKQIRELMGK